VLFGFAKRTGSFGPIRRSTDLVDRLPQLRTDPPSIYVDLEGIDLSREGSISILTFMLYPCEPQKHIYLIDVHILGCLAFNTPGKSGKTMKGILESPAIPKVFFDVRNGSDALYAHFNIALHGVEDVQLMENASRGTGSKRLLKGLAKCIEFDAVVGYHTKRTWKIAKENGEHLFNPQKGGSYEVFNSRPLAEDIRAYCAGDVQYLPHLRNLYRGKLTTLWKVKVADETKNRVLKSQMSNYQPHGKDRALGPWPDEQTFIGKFWNQDDILDSLWEDFEDGYDDDWYDDGGDNDYEDWTRAPWQGPPSWVLEENRYSWVPGYVSSGLEGC